MSQRSRINALFILFVLLLGSLVIPSLADIPQIISYQGKVTDSGGVPVTDGSYAMRFRIFDASSGGTLKWDSNDRSVTVSGGVFSMVLGETPQPIVNLPFDEDYWLEVTIDGDIQSPRNRLGSVGYAYMASGLVPGTEISGSVTTSPYGVITGINTATTGTAYGLYGSSASIFARGVYGDATATSGTTYGLFGRSSSTDGRGVYGLASSTTGTNYGVYGRTESPSGYAGYFQGDARVTGDLTVDGTLTGSGIGDITAVNAGTGLDGGGTSGNVTLDVEVPLSLTGDAAFAGIIHGTNSSANGRGVVGEATSVAVSTAYGVFGTSASPVGRGIHGEATSTFATAAYGVYGTSASPSGRGVYGGATATSGTNFGVYGTTSSPSGYAGYFDGNARVTGDLTVDGAFSASGIGDITAVNAGTGLSGGGTSGNVTLSLGIPLSIAGSVTSAPYAVMKARNTGTTDDVAGIWGESACPGGGGVFGWGTATTGTTYGILGQSASTAGRGAWGYASASSGTTYGVYGEALSTSGFGIYGTATATSGTTYGGAFMTASPSGYGIFAKAAASTGSASGVWGESYAPSGAGVYGYAAHASGSTYGVHGLSASESGKGVFGDASSYSGATYGVYGESDSDEGTGVYGYVWRTSGVTYGVYGESDSNAGRGVHGYASATTGNTYGVSGVSKSSEGNGVFGKASATTGDTFGGRFENYSDDGTGVAGVAYAGSGDAYGGTFSSWSTSGCGVLASAVATTGTNIGVYGSTWSPSGYGVYYSGGLAGTGTKSCVVKTSKGPTLMYCQESPENWFEDFGEGQLANGRCHIELDHLFLETVTINAANPLKVFLQPQDPECEGLAAIASFSGFDAIELKHGTSNGRFTYRVVAKRKGFEERRLEYCASGERDPYLYPEIRE